MAVRSRETTEWARPRGDEPCKSGQVGAQLGVITSLRLGSCEWLGVILGGLVRVEWLPLPGWCPIPALGHPHDWQPPTPDPPFPSSH